jgi:hypothetical protein
LGLLRGSCSGGRRRRDYRRRDFGRHVLCSEADSLGRRRDGNLVDDRNGSGMRRLEMRQNPRRRGRREMMVLILRKKVLEIIENIVEILGDSGILRFPRSDDGDVASLLKELLESLLTSRTLNLTTSYVTKKTSGIVGNLSAIVFVREKFILISTAIIVHNEVTDIVIGRVAIGKNFVKFLLVLVNATDALTKFS